MFREGKEVARFSATFGIDPDSNKYKAFDAATPEGLYFITYKKPTSRFHRFLGISYPNLTDAVRGLTQGVISLKEYKRIARAIQESGWVPFQTGLGSGIGIHGGGVLRYFGNTKERDWTWGCIALNNKDLEKLFDFCKSGDPVVIFNSRRNLYGVIRPFAHMEARKKGGTPDCPDGVCTYQVEIPTSLGRITITLKEGKAYGKSIKVRIYKDNAQEKPLLVLVDRNADGYMSGLDSISGLMAGEKAPDATYEQLREAVISALSKGRILCTQWTR